MFTFSKYHRTHFCHWRSLECFFFILEIFTWSCAWASVDNMSSAINDLKSKPFVIKTINEFSTNIASINKLLRQSNPLWRLARFLSIARVLTMGIKIDNMHPGTHCNCQLYCRSWRKCNKRQTIYLHCVKRNFVSDKGTANEDWRNIIRIAKLTSDMLTSNAFGYINIEMKQNLEHVNTITDILHESFECIFVKVNCNVH